MPLPNLCITLTSMTYCLTSNEQQGLKRIEQKMKMPMNKH